MCIPKPKDPAIPPTNIPSMETASSLDLAGVPRGAAGLARLKLRTGQDRTSQAATSSTPAQDGVVGGSAASAPGTPAREGGDGSSPFLRANVPNRGLHLPVVP